MGRARLAPGETGEPWFVELADGRIQARVRVRGRDGRLREVSAISTSKSAARRALQRRADARQGTGSVGVTPDMTLDQLAEHWLGVRARQSEPGRTRTGRRPVSPQTLGGYAATIRSVVSPMVGQLRVGEVSVAILDAALQDLEANGRSAAQARSVLTQMLSLAVRHGALTANPMRETERIVRSPREVDALNLAEVRALRRHLRNYLVAERVDTTGRRVGGKPRNRDLVDIVDFALGTGARIGEVLAVTWRDIDLAGTPPTVHIGATLVEPRRGFVEELLRQPTTKSRKERTLALPDAVVVMLTTRRRASQWRRLEDPVFASATGTFLWPNNTRTRLRAALRGAPSLEGVTPHTLRRTVGTQLVQQRGIDVARDVLGHSDGSVTWRSYTAQRAQAPDVRDLLDQFFTDPSGTSPGPCGQGLRAV
ncbi:MAG: site-specific integrase [Nocardioides sp.]